VPGTSAMLCSNGVTSKEMVLQHCPAFKKSLDQGLERLIIGHQVETEIPYLPFFLQSAGNKGQGVERKQAVLQLMLESHQTWARVKTYENACELVGTLISKEHPDLGGIRDVLQYVAIFGGGEYPSFLMELLRFSNTLSVRRKTERVEFHLHRANGADATGVLPRLRHGHLQGIVKRSQAVREEWQLALIPSQRPPSVHTK